MVLGLLWCNIGFADDKHLDDFNKWLNDNDYHQYLDKESDNVKYKLDRSVCKSKTLEEDNNIIKKCIGADGTIIPNSDLKFKGIYPNNLNIKTYNNRSEIPEDAKPNEETLLYYFWNYVHGNWANNARYSDIKASENSYQFEFDLREDKYIKKQMQKTALLSYLLYEDGKIVIDEISPKDKFGKVFTNKTKFHSQSVGKSLASYILGHAICKGYVESIDSKINDWPLIENSLYHDQKIIDIINMRAGDKKYFSKKDNNRYTKTGRSVTNTTIKKTIENEFKNYRTSQRTI